MKILSTRHRVAGALGVAVITVAACGSSSSSSSGGGGSATAEETKDPNAVGGGTLNIGLVQEPTSFLAAGWTDSMTFSYAADAPTNEGLLWYRSTSSTQSAKTQADFWRPDLATEVPTVANGDVKLSGCANTAAKMCVTWKLRDGVLWHDGSKFSADDLCATADFIWLRYGANNPTAVLSTSGFDQLIKCTKDNPLQVTLDFKTVYGPYLSLFTGVYGIIPSKLLQAAFSQDADPKTCAAAKACKGDLEKTPQTVDLGVGSGNTAAFKGTDTLDKITDGTGPYVLQSYVPTKAITLVKNTKYWDTKHLPSLDKIVFHIEADVPSQLAAVKAGELDMGLDYRLKFLKDLNDVAKLGKIAVETIPESGAEKIDLNLCSSAKGLCGADAQTPAVLSDVKFRHAMIEGINRQSIVDSVAAGATVVPQDSWLYLGAEYAKSPDVSVTKYDATKAAADLDAAGYKVSSSCHGGAGRADSAGKCIDLNFVTTSGNPARATAQIAIQQDLQKIGIFTNLSTVTAGKLFGAFSSGGVLYNHKFDLAMYTNTMSSPAEPDSYWAGYHADCGGSCPENNQIPSKANNGQGQNDTAEDNAQVDKAMDDGRNSVDLTIRAAAYGTAEKLLAQDLPEIPLYQQVTVNSYSTKLQGLQRNDLVWTFNAYDWYCTGGNCQA
jgi:peptide/nickel transport system substrate-binding protein